MFQCFTGEIHTRFCANGRYLLDQSTHFLVVHHLGRGLEDHAAPTFNIRVCFRRYLQDLCLHFLLGGEQAVPEIIANRAFLEKILQGGLVLPETDNTSDIGHGTADQGGLQKRFGSRRI